MDTRRRSVFGLTERVFVVVLGCCLGGDIYARPAFTDDFNAGASALWSNSLGNWVASGGVYFATAPANNPTTYSLLPFIVGDGSFDVDIRGVSDGGVWIHCDDTRSNGVLLVTGGHSQTGRGFYWHTVHNGGFSGIINKSAPLFNQGDDIHVRVVVSGNTYAAFINGSPTPATTLTTPDFPSGRFGLYDFSAPLQAFDNVSLERTCPADFNNDGVVNTLDLTYLLSRFGLPITPGDPADMNFSGGVDTNDLVSFLAAFGQVCPS